MTNQIKESYCNEPHTCDDFKAAQRKILGSVQFPVNDIRVVVSKTSGEEQHGGNADTSWWQVP